MNNDNVVKIGTALKWRNTFDLNKKYYQENVVTACGCVFRCKVLQAQGKSPVKMTDEQGHMAYTNTDIWDVLVDMAYYYNFAVDTRQLTKEMLDYAKKLDEAFQKQQKEINAIQEDDKNQWSRIKDIEKVNVEQQRELNAVFDTISCFSEGIWIDTLLWSNETIWDNNKYAITDDLQNQINDLEATLHQDIKDLSDKHDSEISALTANIVKQGKIQDGINTYLQEQIYDINESFSCFGTGIWDNPLHWSNDSLWDNNKYAVTDALEDEVKKINEKHKSDRESLNTSLSEHSTHLKKHDDEIADIQNLIKLHDQQIIDLLNALSCFSSGQWDDGLKWSDVTLWENTNLMCDAFEDIYHQIDNHQTAINDLTKDMQNVKVNSENDLKKIDKTLKEFRTEHEAFHKEHQEFKKEHQSITSRLDSHDTQHEEHQREIDTLLYKISVLTNGEWDNTLLWINDSEWVNTSGNISAIENEVIDHDNRLSTLESQFTLFLQQLTAQQVIIQQQQEQLETLMDCFTVLNVGKWQNLLLWDNTSKWSDVLITEAAANDGISTVTVRNYDSKTQTVTI